MRFEVTQTLDAVERRLATDPLAAGAVVDLAEVVRLAALDAGRPATLLRLGLAVDAVARYLGDGGAAVYPVAGRELLADTDLTSNERMVIRRWSDDGLVEILPAGAPVPVRLREIAELTGLAVVTRAALPGFTGTAHALLPAPGGAVLGPHPTASGAAGGHPGTGHPGTGHQPATGHPAVGGHPALGRWWRCPVAGCASFGPPRGPAQPPPAFVAAVPTCPRHGDRLVDAGPRPPALALAVRVDGAVRQRFAVVAGSPVTVGRLPDDASGVALARYLDEQSARWISRSHVRLDLRDGRLTVTDMSTNGTVVVVRTGPAAQPREVALTAGQSHALGEWDAVRLHDGVELRRADRPPAGAAVPVPGSVMSDAPTVALRLRRE